MDMQSGQNSLWAGTLSVSLGQWEGYPDPSLVEEAELRCGALLLEFKRDQVSRDLCKMMQLHESNSEEP